MTTLFRQSCAEPCRYATVVPERGMETLRGLTYAVPDDLKSLRPGERVIIPLGKNDKPVAGYIFTFITKEELPEKLSEKRIKPILRRASEGESSICLTPSLLKMAEWLASYYCCPIGMAIATMIPGSVKRGKGRKTVRLINLPDDLKNTSFDIEAIKLPRGQKAVMQTVLQARDLPLSITNLRSRAGVKTNGPINRLIERGLLTQEISSEVQAKWRKTTVLPDLRPTLTGHQQTLVDKITPGLGGFSVHLIHGVTGSGKTEVYLHVVEKVLAKGKDALILVPEISLTPQTAGRFISRFAPSQDGERPVAILHSGLTAAQRHQEWTRVAQGKVRVVVGARSAVFAPFPENRLGLIIVDEEHDGSYKQDQLPRYNARDVAIRRGQLEKATVILGSATPSLESYHNALAGKFQLHVLNERATGAKMPRVHIVDFIKANRERPKDGRIHLLTPVLAESLKRTLSDGGQAMLLLNRRGYASYICCPDHRCGWVLTCDYCDATMVYHRPPRHIPGNRANSPDGEIPEGGLVRCHHCLAEKVLPIHCPQCGKKTVTFGFGTQRVEREIAELLPDMDAEGKILRLDSDTMKRAVDYHNALDRFANGEVRLLVGTQMIAKGLDFPNVRLVGIINADTALNLPDFRAAERTFQLVSQVAGRSGRAEHPGIVIVQTMQPDAEPIIFAVKHDYRGFAERELEFRRQSNLPPWTRMARIVIRHKDHLKCYEVAQHLATELSALGRSFPRIRQYGPMPCPISRIAGFHRQAIELIAPDARQMQQLLTAARNARLLKSDSRMAIDVDPVALL